MPAPVNAFGQPIGPRVEGWTSRPYPERRLIEGHVCRLEPVDPASHADRLFQAFAEASDGRDWTYLPDEYPTDLAAYRTIIAERAASRDPLHFAIVVDGAPSGTVALMRIDPANGVIEIGHVVFARRLQRTRAGTEAIALLMRHAFDDLGYRRVEWKCDVLNAPSRRAAARYGFTFEGVFRKAVVVKGRSRDTAWFSAIDDEWPLLRDAFKAWLAPGNFDEAGHQIRSLEMIRTKA